MPSFTIHLAVAKKYLEKHPEENEEEFLRGIIEPDLKDKSISHFGEYSSSPDLNRYFNEIGLQTSYNRGYFLHLVTDYLFYNKFLDRFSGEIYDDYDKLNDLLVERYNLEIPKEIQGVTKFKMGSTQILEFNSICNFIDSIGMINLEDYIRVRPKQHSEQGEEIE